MSKDFILVTGANGFVGQSLCAALLGLNFKVRGVIRGSKILPKGVESIDIHGVDGTTIWSKALMGCNQVIHLAARVHVIDDDISCALEQYRQVNVEGTLHLATQAAAAGVKRFIYISSIKVNGESTLLDLPFHADDKPNPQDPYGISKWEAEQGLQTVSYQTGMEVVIIRSPLVYGPGVKANFLSMMKWLQRGIPLPFGGVAINRRSFIFLGNLVDMIITCINHPAAANQTFLVSDDEDLSTASLLDHMALALGRPLKLITVPTVLITLGAKLIGRSGISRRLCGSLQVDIKKTKDLLGWSPPVSVDEGLRQTAAHFLKMKP